MTREKPVELTAYQQRDILVALLARVWPSHLARHVGDPWEDDWRNIVCLHTPQGQATFHIHDSELPLFRTLRMEGGDWDGHGSEEKFDRLIRLIAYMDYPEDPR